MEEIAPLPAGAIVGNYRIVETIGTGGFAIVYRARDLMLECDVALKEHAPRGLARRVKGSVVPLPGAKSDFDEVASRLLAEFRLLSGKLQHSHIARAIAMITGSQGSFLVSEYVEGLTLKAARIPLELSQLRGVFRPILNACEALHSQGFVHCDITPGNLILNHERGPVLIDFGLAQPIDAVSDNGRRSPVLANPRYAAPEQLSAGAALTPATDIYYLAGAMYFAITGRPPHSGRDGRFLNRSDDTTIGYFDPRDARTAHPRVSDDAAMPELYPPEFLAAIDRALDPDPARRPATIGIFREALGWSKALLLGFGESMAWDSISSEIRPTMLSATQIVGLGAMRREAGRSRFRPVPASSSIPRKRERPSMMEAPDETAAFRVRRSAPSDLGEAQPPPSVSTRRSRVGDPDTSHSLPRDLPPPASAPPSPRQGGNRTLRYGAAAVAAASAIAIGALAWRAAGSKSDIAPWASNPPAQRGPMARGDNGGDWVDVSLFAPAQITFGSEALFQLFLHAPDESPFLMALVSEIDADASPRGAGSLVEEIARGTRLTIVLQANGFDIAPASQVLVWHGRPSGCQFTLRHTGEADVNPIVTAMILKDGVPIGRLSTRLAMVTSVRSAADGAISLRDAEAVRYRSAFLSYSSQDRGEVLRRAQALRAVGIACFQDVLNLVPGERWPERLRKEVESADLFLLFWSQAARASPHVREEIGWALARRAGGDTPEIRPILLEGPPAPAPPDELADMHFDDPLCYVMSAWAARPS